MPNPFAASSPQPIVSPPTKAKTPFGRGIYAAVMITVGLLATIFASVQGLELIGLLFALGAFVPVVFRLHDIGASGWWSLLTLVPLANLILGYYLVCAPTGYAITKTPDKAMKVLSIVFVAFIALMALGLLIPALS